MYLKDKNKMIIDNEDDVKYYKENFIDKNMIVADLYFTNRYKYDTIPNGIVAGTVRLNRHIKVLPEKLTCNVLSMSHSRVKKIPSTNNIVSIKAQNLKYHLDIPGNKRYGYLDFFNSKKLKSLPENIICNMFMDIAGTKILYLPNETYIGSWYFFNQKNQIYKYYTASLDNDSFYVGGFLYMNGNEISILKSSKYPGEEM